MPIENPPPHLKELLSNVGETATLLDIHNAVGGTGPGRRRGIEVLNKSAIVLVVACWEAYVEDLAKTSLEFMIKHAADHRAFPDVVLERVASKNNGLKAWTLAGDGWKKALMDNLTEVLARTTGTLNTPRAAQVDELFAKTIGKKDISKTWKWSGWIFRPREASVPRHGKPAFRLMGSHDSGPWEASDGCRVGVVVEV